MNYIKSLTIEGLKKFEHFDIEFDKNINIIILKLLYVFLYL